MTANLDAIIHQLEEERNRLDSAIQTLRGLTSVPTAQPKSTGRGGFRKLSPAARARIVAAQRARWAKYHQAQGKAKAGTRRGPRHMSAAARARIAAAQKARWARVRAKQRKKK